MNSSVVIRKNNMMITVPQALINRHGHIKTKARKLLRDLTVQNAISAGKLGITIEMGVVEIAA